MSPAHRKLRALAGLALGASLAMAGCGDAGDGASYADADADADAFVAAADPPALERLGTASAGGAPSGTVVGLVEKPAPLLPPNR